MFKLYRLKNYNFRLIIWLLMISGIGVLLVGSAKASLQSRQLIGVILGLVVMVAVSLMDYSWLLNFYWIIYVFNIVMLLIVRFFGDSAGGATRWLDLGFIRFQPTELSKILLIMFFARFLMDHEDTLNTWKTILASVALLAVPLVLIKIQPDLKNTITVTVVFCLLMYVAGLSYKIIGVVLGIEMCIRDSSGAADKRRSTQDYFRTVCTFDYKFPKIYPGNDCNRCFGRYRSCYSGK